MTPSSIPGYQAAIASGNGCPPVSPEAVAIKLAKLRNYEYPMLLEKIIAQPRFVELLWLLEYMSWQPGGLDKFTAELIEAFPKSIGTRSMHQIGSGNDAPYTLDQCRAVYADIPSGRQVGFPAYYREEIIILDAPETESAAERLAAQEDFNSQLTCLNRGAFYQFCLESARENLASYLAGWIHDVSQDFVGPWYWHDLPNTLFNMMDLHAKKACQHLAMTDVAVKVFDALDYAWSEKVMVHIEGDSRFGKTEAVQTWCAMYPGRARLITVPCSNSDSDYFKAVAEALGIASGYKVQNQALKAKVEYIVRHGGLMLVHDEGAFLLPQRFSETTPPMRLNWLRTQVVDRKNPCAIVTTPQSYRHSINKFVKKTGYSFEQFLGRTDLHVYLPSDLGEKDLLAVAKIHFPGLDCDYLELIASKAMQSESYLKSVESAARRSRYLARQAGRNAITIADVEMAFDQVLPRNSTTLTGKHADERPAPAIRKPQAPARALQTDLRMAAVGLEMGQTSGNRISRVNDSVIANPEVVARESELAFAAS